MAAYGRGSFGGIGFTPDQTAINKVTEGESDFDTLSKAIAHSIQKITHNVSQIQKLISRIGTKKDSQETRDKVHQLTHYTNQLAKETTANLKLFTGLKVPSSDELKLKIQRDRYKEKFSNAVKSFQAAQRTAARKERASVARARAHSPSFKVLIQSPFEDVPKDKIPSIKRQRLSKMEKNVDLETILERENAIKELEHDITEINEIFKELGALVHEQGEVINTIDDNVDTAVIHIHEAKQDLARAVSIQENVRSKKCLCLVVLIVGVGIIIAILLPVLLTINK
ncbi:syntaxin-7-like [Mytilus californianus]|uniref:syntaxin-7-like n=1 Tax=Mytilus californianus TaxID=6549 RepID=UPI002246BF81|nr:syntaxin-7-like [Mytilus californianus]